MTLYANGIKVCPTIKVGNGDIDHGGEYHIKVIDYDGTILKQDHLDTGATFELPNAPTHERLTFDTWSSPLPITNNSITVGKSDIIIGAVYTINSGLIEVVIELTPFTGLEQRILQETEVVDWGDGTSEGRVHTYSDYGKYIATFTQFDAMSFGASPESTDNMLYGTPTCATREIYVPANLSGEDYFYNMICAPIDFIVFENGYELNETLGQSVKMKHMIIPPRTSEEYPGNSRLITMSSSLTYNLKDIVIPYGTENIEYCLHRCVALEKVYFPSTVTSLGLSGERCMSLKEINFTEHQQVPTLTSSTSSSFFNHVPTNLKIRVPKVLENEWKTATNWSILADRIVGV